MSTLMIAGGGTGGHIYPAIAIAQEYIARDSSRKVVFVGTERGLEKNIVPKAGFPLEFIAVSGLKGKGAAEILRSLMRLPAGFHQAWRLVGKHRPDVALGVGGYSSGPVLVAAKLRGVATMIHEQNAFPGLTNRVLARFADAVGVAFDQARPRLRRPDAVLTGNPVRAEFFAIPPRAAGPRKRLLVFGGSQGSHILNQAMTGALLFLAHLREQLEITHQTGPKDLEAVRSAYLASAFSGAQVVPYLDPMSAAMADADLVVSRAGAMTIGELAAAGRGAILVPFAAATNNHQEMNARVMEAAGGAVVVTEEELSAERLAGAISNVMLQPQKCAEMGASARRLSAPEATKSIVEIIEKIQRK
ncbi:MAG TPA: undecaprenyldiphospho-muramoylpentapeptide beta-N-acetylglucosaminyltransferase [Thermoanaerobaculia bacterium]|nr:undecaprenyldiphospho-muramoylpentapeptide beta-N-acetylglucosaminyltransferase [Thermoanaerobaculia bacterium]